MLTIDSRPTNHFKGCQV